MIRVRGLAVSRSVGHQDMQCGCSTTPRWRIKAHHQFAMAWSRGTASGRSLGPPFALRRDKAPPSHAAQRTHQWLAACTSFIAYSFFHSSYSLSLHSPRSTFLLLLLFPLLSLLSPLMVAPHAGGEALQVQCTLTIRISYG